MELGATDAEAGRKTGAEVGLGVLAAETGAAEEITGKECGVGVTEACSTLCRRSSFDPSRNLHGILFLITSYVTLINQNMIVLKISV